MGVNNSFIKLQETANGRVSVKLQKNYFAKDGTENFYGKVERYTYSSKNILEGMSELLPMIDTGTMASVLNAHTTVVLNGLSAGTAVKFGELGTYYIAGKGTVDSENTKLSLTVKFTATQMLKEAVQTLEIASSEYIEPSGEITSITNVATGKTDGKLIANASVLVEGSGLKVGGENSGIWISPVDENGDITSDVSSWIKIEGILVYNLPSKLLFNIPATVASGKYRIVIRSRFSKKATYERKYLTETVSDIVEIV